MRNRNKGFSLVELVIVVVIIGVLAAIAIPRLSRGASGAADSSVHGNLKVLRTAIDLYASEHGGAFPGTADVVRQLTQKTKDDGTTSSTASENIYGPYLREIPPLPVGAEKGSKGMGAAAAGIGWVYEGTGGTVKTNTTTSEKDAKGTEYSTY